MTMPAISAADRAYLAAKLAGHPYAEQALAAADAGAAASLIALARNATLPIGARVTLAETAGVTLAEANAAPQAPSFQAAPTAPLGYVANPPPSAAEREAFNALMGFTPGRRRPPSSANDIAAYGAR